MGFALLMAPLLALPSADPPAGVGADEAARRLFIEAMDAHRDIRRVSYSYRVVDILSAGETSISQAGRVAVERHDGEPLPRFHVRGVLIDHHPLGLEASHLRPLEPVMATYDGKVLTVIDVLAHETLTASDPKNLKRLSTKPLWFLPTWLQPQPFSKEKQILDSYEEVTVTREPDIEVAGVPVFALRLRARKQFTDDSGGTPRQLVHRIDSTYFFRKDNRLLLRVIERHSEQFTRIHEVEFLQLEAAPFPPWTFQAHPPEGYARRDLSAVPAP